MMGVKLNVRRGVIQESHSLSLLRQKHVECSKESLFVALSTQESVSEEMWKRAPLCSDIISFSKVCY